LETAFLSIITFSREANQIVPLTELLQVQVPTFTVRTGTSLGAALRLLAKSIRTEVGTTTETVKGDYRPLVFLMTDGQPTDQWEDAADAMRGMKNPKIANFYAIACGTDVDTDVLYRITDVVLNMPDMSPEKFRKFFVWLTASVSSASISVADQSLEMPVNIAQLPEGVLEIAPRIQSRNDKQPRQVFLHARCGKTKKPYLMRFLRESDGPYYIANASHPLEETDDENNMSDLPPVDSSCLLGCPPCPYCGNPRAGLCPCGTLFCNAETPEGVILCPKCNNTLAIGGTGAFKVNRSDG